MLSFNRRRRERCKVTTICEQGSRRMGMQCVYVLATCAGGDMCLGPLRNPLHLTERKCLACFSQPHKSKRPKYQITKFRLQPEPLPGAPTALLESTEDQKRKAFEEFKAL